MLTNNPKINSLKYNDAVSKLMENEETRHVISEMSFGEYHKLIEASADIVPPSGQIITPKNKVQAPGQNIAKAAPVAAAAPVAGQAPGPGQPIQQMNTQQQTPQAGQTPAAVAGQAVQQQAGALLPKGANVPMIPGLPGAAGIGQPNQPPKPGQPIQTVTPTEEEMELERLAELSGIGEMCSGGATGAGAIAMAPKPMGAMKKRQPTEESPSLEHPVSGRKTIPGATGPQASAIHKLSANNAVRGNPTPFRTNAGIRK